MALKIQSKKGTATTTQQVVDNKAKTVLSEDAQEEKVETPASEAPQTGPWCEVGVDASYTHNLGNYQSAKVGVSLKIPCQHGEIDDVFEYAQSWVDAKMQTMMAELQSE